MGKIKNWLSDIRYWFSELSGVWVLLLLVVVGSLAYWGITDFFGKEYEKFRPNYISCVWAESQFKNLCGPVMPHKEGVGVEYCEFYDKRSQAINDFMALARMFDSQYANGKFRHIYVLRNERVYQCWDRDKRLIAIRFKKHRAGIWYGYKGEWKPFYELDLYIQNEREE